MNAMVSVKQAGEPVYLEMGADLLSQQPVSYNRPPELDDFKWGCVFDALEARLGSLRNWRYSWWSYWSSLAQFFLPRRYTWIVVPNKMTRGNPINDAIIDATGTLALETCAAGMWSGLTNPARPWIKMESALPWLKVDAEGQEWLDDTQERLYSVLAGSNFYTILAQAFQDLALFGTAPFIIYEDFEDVIRLYLPCAGEYYLGTGARLARDTLYREFNYTVLQIVEMFGAANCPEQIRKLWMMGGSSLDQEFVVCHAIEPNFAIQNRGTGKSDIKVVPAVFTYREVYWLKGIRTAKPLSIAGFHGKPFSAMIWSQVSNDAYGRSPCMTALGDNKQVQLETRRKAEFIEKLVRPPMGANPELKNEPSSIIPGNITYTNTENGKKGFWPLFEVQPAALTPMIADIKEVNARIEKALFVDVFMAITQMEGVQPRNELELTKRDLERLQKLGPVIELVEAELRIALERVLDIMQRRKLLKPKPASLQKIPLKISFLSIMRIAQKSSTAVSIKDFMATMGGVSSAAKAAGVPDPLRKVNLDKMTDHFAEVMNVPQDILYTDQEVKQHDEIRSQEMAKAQAPNQAMAAVQAAKTLSETQIGPGNALGALTGATGPQ
jgi:hypothetical protein